MYDKQQESVEVFCEDGTTFVGDYVVSTLPLGVLKEMYVLALIKQENELTNNFPVTQKPSFHRCQHLRWTRSKVWV